MRLILVVLLLLPFALQSQERVYRNYTVEDGLPSSEVYFSFIDSKGYIWFATDAGVSRFNGYEFENFGTASGLTDNTIFRITEDAKGRIWFAPFNGRFCYYEKGKITEFIYKKNKKLNGLYVMKSFFVDKDENIWLGTLEDGIYVINKQGIKSVVKERTLNELSMKGVFHTENVSMGTAIPLDIKALYIKENKPQRFRLTIERNNKTIYQDSAVLYDFLKNRHRIKHPGYLLRTFAYTKNSLIFDNYFTEELYLYTIKNDQVLKKVYDFSMFKDKDILYLKHVENFVWVTVREGGVYKFQLLEEDLLLLSHEFPTESISSINFDQEGGTWYTSVNSGVLYIPNHSIIKRALNNKKIFQIETDTVSQTIFINTKDGIYNHKNNRIIENKGYSFGAAKVYFDYEKKALLWGAYAEENTPKMYTYKDKRVGSLPQKFDVSPGFKSVVTDGDTMYLGTHNGVIVLYPEKTYVSNETLEGKIWCTSLMKIDGKLWIGTNTGIKLYRNDKIIDPFPQDSLLKVSITCMERFNDSIVLVGTKGRGVFVFKNETLYGILNDSLGLSSNLIRTIHVDNKRIVWIGTNKGVDRVHYDGQQLLNSFNLNKKNGLVSEEITEIKSIKDSIYIGTAKGLMAVNRKDLRINKLAPILRIKSVLINSKEKPYDSLQLLRYNDNNISIGYEGLNYRSQGTVDYHYRLLGEGLDTTWKVSQARITEYTLLPPGTYSFEVKADNEDGIWSQLEQISFTIHPPFWKTWWFIVSMFLFFGSIVFLIVYNYFKNREKQLQIEKQLVELELKALRSQMNPHFIFNILNSIQHYMLNNNFKETNRYLTQFARLIRTVLNVSEKQYISIGEELEMLRLYMNLEKMRFENGFDYEIIVDEAIDEDYDEIPSMLIQPYVENAIWHGLMNRGTKGKITISIALKEGVLYCTIDDNGVGRAAAAKLKARRKIKSKSVGMRITKDRLNILNEDSNINVIIEDKKDKESLATGTKVTIRVGYTN
ncbi:MAG: histidine kinase [Flavobacteriales bacterium]|jgi:hypothetical protein|nr:histidine kinase [Flavobacteriales bacterium]